MNELIGKIDKNSIIPFYYQLQEVLENLIEQGYYKPDEKLPSENDLKEYLGISRATAQRAIKNLVDRGLAYRIQGKGTFVANKSIRFSIVASLSFSAEMIGMNKKVRSKLICADEIKAHKLISKMLKADENTRFYSIQRLRYVDEVPIALQTSYLPVDLVPGLIHKDIEEHSMFMTIKNEYGLNIVDAEETLQAVKATSYEANLLNIKPGDSVFLLERITKIDSGEVLEFVKTILRGDKGKFYVEVLKQEKSENNSHG
ncbi:MAG: GntR family transcriptional regulator [Candidatus Marinimicrobia bacterium]|nr:GntR family transcriptional regulator [Candidatus Neomarinimicrobiota bacterium]MDD5582694.1 GntR family transcriptional regulator [Candidatus Neomarinimicrobiota bacterium]